MSALSARISSLAPFLLQAPPGQLENVYNDIAGLLLAEEEAEGSSLNAREVNAQLRKATDSALRDHNEQQFVVVKVKSAEAVDSRDVESTILCKEARIQQRGNDRYRHARLPVSFEIDHKTLVSQVKLSRDGPSIHNKQADVRCALPCADYYRRGAIRTQRGG